MKWTFGIKNKLMASVVLLALCLLVLLSNYLDRKHTESVKNSISTLYEDRLVAEIYIWKMTGAVYEIREKLNSARDDSAKSKAIAKLVQDVNATYDIYSKTWLTDKEKTTASEFIAQFRLFERELMAGNFEDSGHTQKLLASLGKLSAIQLDESKLIMKKVESEYDSIKASSQLAFGIIIVILVVLQIMVFSGESIIPIVKPKDPRLN